MQCSFASLPLLALLVVGTVVLSKNDLPKDGAYLCLLLSTTLSGLYWAWILPPALRAAYAFCCGEWDAESTCGCIKRRGDEHLIPIVLGGLRHLSIDILALSLASTVVAAGLIFRTWTPDHLVDLPEWPRIVLVLSFWIWLLLWLLQFGLLLLWLVNGLVSRCDGCCFCYPCKPRDNNEQLILQE